MKTNIVPIPDDLEKKSSPCKLFVCLPPAFHDKVSDRFKGEIGRIF